MGERTTAASQSRCQPTNVKPTYTDEQLCPHTDAFSLMMEQMKTVREREREKEAKDEEGQPNRKWMEERPSVQVRAYSHRKFYYPPLYRTDEK